MKQNSIVIGLTGGIATGKSTVTNYLIEKGYNVIDCDLIAREVVYIGEDAYKDIIIEFGEDIILETGEINRKALGSIVFSDSQKLDKLNRITHHRIIYRVNAEIERLKEDGIGIIFVDAPLLFEISMEGICDKVWLISVSLETQIDRLMKRDNISKDKALRIINSQMTLEEKSKRSQLIINNEGSLVDLYKKVERSLENI